MFPALFAMGLLAADLNFSRIFGTCFQFVLLALVVCIPVCGADSEGESGNLI